MLGTVVAGNKNHLDSCYYYFLISRLRAILTRGKVLPWMLFKRAKGEPDAHVGSL